MIAMLVALLATIYWIGRAQDRHPERWFALYMLGWAILGAAMAAAMQCLAWYMGDEARRGLGGPIEVALFLVLFPMTGVLLLPVVVMAAGSGRSFS